MPSIEKIRHAKSVVSEIIRATDLIPAPKLSSKCELYLKPENLQTTGSFKVRGAYYKMSLLSDEEKKHGVIACSAGNHAQGVALAATKSGIASLICLPDGAPISKVESTRAYGADICLVKGDYDDTYEHALKLQKEHNYTFIHPFDDDDVIAGQGTIGLEILEQLHDVDIVVVPVGGGGLIAGVASAIKAINPKCKVYGVQAQGAASMAESLKEHKRHSITKVSTIADGIAVKLPGKQTFEICESCVDDIVTVSDDEISAAILALMENHRLITEGAGAVATAAIMFDKIPLNGEKVVSILSGGNIDVTILSRVINRGLLMSGRTSDITIQLTDKPGQLSEVSTIIAQLGANVVSVHHDKGDLAMEVTGCYLRIALETKNHAHIEEVRNALTDAGFLLVENRNGNTVRKG